MAFPKILYVTSDDDDDCYYAGSALPEGDEEDAVAKYQLIAEGYVKQNRKFVEVK